MPFVDQKSGVFLAPSPAPVATGDIVWSTNPVAGAKVICYVQCHTPTITSVIDNGTSPTTFTLDASHTGSSKNITLYRGDNITLPATGSYKVTVTVSIAGDWSAGGVSYVGVASGGPTTTGSNGNAVAGTAVTTGSITGTGKSNLYVGAMNDGDAGNPSSITFNGPGTQELTELDGSGTGAWPAAMADFIGTGAVNMSWTITSSTFDACIAVYQGAPAVGASVVTQQAIYRASRW